MRLYVNFASREYIIARKVYGSLIAGALVLAGLFVYQYSVYASSQARYEELASELSDVKSAEASSMARYREISAGITQVEIDRTISEAAFANGVLLSKSFSWTLFLNRIEELTPKGVGVTTISPDFDSLYINIAGTADDMGKLLKFMDTLTKSEYFEDLPPSFSTSTQTVDRDTGKTVEVFNIKIKYYPEGSGKTAEAEG